MDIVLFILGLALVIAAVVDALWTTLWIDGGAGPITSRLTTWTWRGALAVIGHRRHHILSYLGPTNLVLTVLTWIVLLWAGWVLLFASSERSLTHVVTSLPADWAGTFYFVGYMMFTAGNGDYSPGDGGWQVAAALTNASGMLLATLAITYLLSVISAAVRKRAFAGQVAGIGRSPEEVVLAGWNGHDFHDLDLTLSALSSRVATLSEQYLSYPVLQYYHAAKPEKSPALGIAILDEALTMLHAGVPQEHHPNRLVLHSARSAVETFLDTLPSAFIQPAPTPAPAPNLDALRQAGIPTVSDEAFAAALERQSDRRRRLLGLVRRDGWPWLGDGANAKG